MLRLRGNPLGGGLACGAAVLVRDPRVPVDVPPSLVPALARAARGEPMEPMDVVVVGATLAGVEAAAAPWGHVVAVVVEGDESGAPPPGVAAVGGVEAARASVRDQEIVLVDGDRGMVLVDPTAVDLAAYQADRERIAPRRRLYLDFEHLPARTLDGRECHVLAAARSLSGVDAAVAAGADGVYVPEGGVAAAGAAEAAWLETARAAAGKPLIVAGDHRTLPLRSVLRAAALAELTLAVPARGVEGPPWSDVEGALADARDRLLDADAAWADPLLAAVELPGGDALAALPAAALSRVVAELDADDPGAADRLADLVAAATPLLLPVLAALAAPDEERVAAALGAGAAGFVVAPDRVQETKATLRGLDAAFCRLAAAPRL